MFALPEHFLSERAKEMPDYEGSSFQWAEDARKSKQAMLK